MEEPEPELPALCLEPLMMASPTPHVPYRTPHAPKRGVKRTSSHMLGETGKQEEPETQKSTSASVKADGISEQSGMDVDEAAYHTPPRYTKHWSSPGSASDALATGIGMAAMCLSPANVNAPGLEALTPPMSTKAWSVRAHRGSPATLDGHEFMPGLPGKDRTPDHARFRRMRARQFDSDDDDF